jgi:uncharacterized protein (TIGR02001 family)
MNLSQGLGAIVLMASAAAAHAEFTGTVTATTDYDWRGITQSAQDPALQGSLDYASDIGLHGGVWASNVDFGEGDPNMEIDFYAGWGGGEEYPWDIGFLYYTYPGASDSNFPEAYGSLGWKWFTAKVSYSWDFAGTSENAMYYEGNVAYDLPHNFGLTGHLGYSDGDGIEAAYGEGDYMDWSAGVTYTWGHFDFALKWVDGSDMKTLNDTHDDISSSDARAIFSVSTTFPWKAEGE